MFKSSILAVINIIKLLNIKTTQMASNKLQSKQLKDSIKMEKQTGVQAPPFKKDQASNCRAFCKKHSTFSKKQFIKFININYFQPKLRKKSLPVKSAFLCDVCISQMKNIRNSRQAFPYIKSLEKFEKQYVESVFKTYLQQNDVEKKTQVIKQTEKIFNQQIERIAQSINKTLQDYKNLFRGIFDTLIDPIKQENFKKFREGQFDEKIIRQLYSNSQKVQKYSSLIGQNYLETLRYTCGGLKTSFQELQRIVKDQLFVSQHLIKKMIKTLKNPQSINEIKNMSSSSSSQMQENQQGLIWKRIKMMQEDRKKQLSRRKQIRERSMSQNRQRNTSEEQEKQQKQVPSSERKKIPMKKQSKPPKKHKIIRRQKLERPARRSDVHIIGERYLLKENKKMVHYMVNKTQTLSVQGEEILYLQRSQFIKKYPEAYKVFEKDSLRKTQTK